MIPKVPAVWFLAVRAGTGTDTFTKELAAALNAKGYKAEITWLPHRAEYAPWSVAIPEPPDWATVAHVGTWLHRRFLPKKLPIVATLHHSMHDPSLRPYKSWIRFAYHRTWILRLERDLLRRTDQIVAVSYRAGKIAREQLTDKGLTIVHNGVDVEVFRPARKKSRGAQFKLAYVGKWTQLKGVHLLPPLMKALGDGFILECVGVSADQVGSTLLPGNIVLKGRITNRDEMVATLQESDALVFPSRSEGLPLVVIEAMACGLPVIAAGGSSATELVEDRVTGLICPRDDIDAFAQACSMLASNDELRESMGVNARRRAEERFSLSRMCEAYLSIYFELLRMNGPQDFVASPYESVWSAGNGTAGSLK